MTRALRSTLLELVKPVADYAETDTETAATVVHLVNSGRARRPGAARRRCSQRRRRMTLVIGIRAAAGTMVSRA